MRVCPVHDTQKSKHKYRFIINANFQITVSSGRVRSIEFTKTEQDPDTNEWFEDSEQGLTLKCEWVISAFGSTLIDENGMF